MGRLKDILQQQRKLNFVGRQKELDLFDQLLQQQHLWVNKESTKMKATHKYHPLQPTGLNLALTLADNLTKAIALLENSPKEETVRRVLYHFYQPGRQPGSNP